MTNLSSHKGQRLDKLPIVDKLTPVEQKVAALLAQGMTNKQIAEAMGWKPKSVSPRVTVTKEKLASMGFGYENSNR